LFAKQEKNMKLSLTLLTLAVALVYGIIVGLFPEFPISQEVLLAFVVWALLRLGVEVVEPVMRAKLVAKGFRGFQK
jgi:hypothetical protein